VYELWANKYNKTNKVLRIHVDDKIAVGLSVTRSPVVTVFGRLCPVGSGWGSDTRSLPPSDRGSAAKQCQLGKQFDVKYMTLGNGYNQTL